MKKRKIDRVSASENECEELNSVAKNEHISKSSNNSSNDNNQLDVQQIVRNEPDLETGNIHLNLNTSKNSIFSFEDLTSDDEIYTFQSPQTIGKQTLCTKTIDFSNPKQLISSNNQLYQFEILKSDKKDITLAFPKKSSNGLLTVLPFKGHIVLHKIVEKPDFEFSSGKDLLGGQKVIFPDDIKVRHPLLGVDWKTHIDNSKDSLKNLGSPRKKRKKIKSEKHSGEFE